MPPFFTSTTRSSPVSTWTTLSFCVLAAKTILLSINISYYIMHSIAVYSMYSTSKRLDITNLFVQWYSKMRIVILVSKDMRELLSLISFGIKRETFFHAILGHGLMVRVP